MVSRILVPGLLLISALTLVGCGKMSPNDAIASVNKTNVHRLANLYVRFQTEHRWAGPKDEEELRAYIDQLDPMVLERMGIDPTTTDDLFQSEIDGEPFKIRYGVRGNARGSNEAVVFESTGKGGVRRVGFTSTKVEEVDDDARYQGLLDGSIREPLQPPQAPGPAA